LTTQPDAYEQLTLELINHARMDPDGEFARLILNAGSRTGANAEITNAIRYFDVNMSMLQSQLLAFNPVQPLAWSNQLSNSATTHSQLMVQFDQQGHFLPGEPGMLERVQQAGYFPTQMAENVFAYAEDPLYTHAAFVIDWGPGPGGMQTPAGHRNAILSTWAQEIGIGAVAENNPATQVGPMLVTHHIASRAGYQAQLLGVVIDDRDNDNFYDIGEGLGGVTVTAVGAAGTFSTTTWDAGGYQMVLPAGLYTVTYSGNGMQQSYSVTMGSANNKFDVERLAAPNLDDIFYSTAANQVFDGNAGFDTAVYTGNRADFSLSGNRSGFTVTGPGHGTDTLFDIEKVQFSDRSYNLQAAAVAEQVPLIAIQSIIDLYIGYFDRVPEASGLVYWINELRAGASLDQIAARFYQAGVQYSDQTGYSANMPVRDFVLIAYANVLGREGFYAPSNDEVNYWTNNILLGNVSREGMIKQMLFDARGFYSDPTWWWVPATLDNKVDFGYLHAVTYGVDYNSAAAGIQTTRLMADNIDENGITLAIQLMGLGPNDYV
jgi:hypothetical protein